MRTVIAVILLAAQFGFVIAARFNDARYYCWAPHDAQNEYHVRVWVDGTELDPIAVEERYRLTTGGVDPRAIAHVIYSIRQYETTYGKGDGAQVLLEYTTNGGPLQRWIWPEG